jgi:putative transposase
MTLLVRAFSIEEINGWDETALHDYLKANHSLRCGFGFETLPDQSTFWRGWNHRFSENPARRRTGMRCHDCKRRTGL